ncbi:MAG: SDR family oxidoreductase [Bacteroidetes bacterium]|nr:SDR family oxidoreductase [Bacteroidota bacterium]
MNNKICLITGATSGIGKETAKALSKMGATIVITSRNLEKGEIVKKEIIAFSNNANVEVIKCDLSSFSSIKECVDLFKSKYSKLDVLINNAGIWETERKLSKDDIELNFATNHLAPFLLTNLLLDTLKASPNSRIVNLASSAHKMGTINFDDLEAKNSFSSFRSYGQSKLANILFTKKLAELLNGTTVTANCLHPGVVSTRLFDKMSSFQRSLFGMFMISPLKGAQTSIYLASSPEVSHISGEYFAKSKISKSTAASKDMAVAEKLWNVSLEYVKNYLNEKSSS